MASAPKKTQRPAAKKATKATPSTKTKAQSPTPKSAAPAKETASRGKATTAARHGASGTAPGKAARAAAPGFFGFDFASCYETAGESFAGMGEGAASVVYCGDEKAFAETVKRLEKGAHGWQAATVTKRVREIAFVSLPEGPFGVICPKRPTEGLARDFGMHVPTPYAQGRDLAGQLYAACEASEIRHVAVRFERVKGEEILGFLVGLDLAHYRFLRYRPGKRTPVARIQFHVIGVDPKWVGEARLAAQSVNMARHLVNVPPSDLNPKAYADAVAALFEGVPHVSVDVWDEKRLAAERMNLILAVGRAAAETARVVRVSYRPNARGKVHPLVFVGKGVTFDSGGLDIKPPDGMRLMKKDMGGSAAVCALAYWVAHHSYFKPCDFYLCLAENAVDSESFKPGDVIVSRGGQSVEIDNTDAEGRLVMAESLELATEAGQEPECVIDVATLTGAVKVGLGADLAGLFANDPSLSQELMKAAQSAGDPVWPMPLFAPYEPQLRSPVADMKNSAASRFGGAITAALFLEKFVNKRPWAHLDIYAWTDIPRGALREPGASGQAVQLLIEFLRHARVGRHA